MERMTGKIVQMHSSTDDEALARLTQTQEHERRRTERRLEERRIRSLHRWFDAAILVAACFASFAAGMVAAIL